ncbi:hypothetical protein AMECASPLE_031442 [Ameca splendens]|uniref:Uncharacterized protein n=1 Tax=Ameca splendens TaxID=208324 RepID=A0ABV0XVB0_9TELE
MAASTTWISSESRTGETLHVNVSLQAKSDNPQISNPLLRSGTCLFHSRPSVELRSKFVRVRREHAQAVPVVKY